VSFSTVVSNYRTFPKPAEEVDTDVGVR